jgi:hypothetical protein
LFAHYTFAGFVPFQLQPVNTPVVDIDGTYVPGLLFNQHPWQFEGYLLRIKNTVAPVALRQWVHK